MRTIITLQQSCACKLFPDNDECSGTIKVCTLPHMTCKNTIGSYKCGCKPGFYMNQTGHCEGTSNLTCY